MKAKHVNRMQMLVIFAWVYLFVRCGYSPLKQWLVDGQVVWNTYEWRYELGAALGSLLFIGIVYMAIIWGYPWLKQVLGNSSDSARR